MTIKVLDLFAGAGGFTLAGEMAGGFETVAFCEIDKHAHKVLRKNWPNVPLYDDVTKLKGSDVGEVGLITGGFPCQDLSVAGVEQGLSPGTRSGLFREMLRLAEECGRPIILFENSPRLISGRKGDWFREFLRSLSEIRYNAEWTIVRASDFGAAHRRERACVIGYPHENAGKQLFSIPEYYEAKRQSYKICNHAPLRDELGERRGEVVEGWIHDQPTFLLRGNGISSKSSGLSAGIMGNSISPPIWAVVMEAIREKFGER